MKSILQTSTNITSHLELPSIEVILSNTHVKMSKVHDYSLVFGHLSAD